MLLIILFLNISTVYLICSFLRNLFLFYIILFALIILNSEILSLLSAFNASNILIISTIELILASIFFIKTKEKFYFPNIKEELLKIKNAFILDKNLGLLGLIFIFMLFCFGILAIVTPPLEPDSRMYHFVRIFDYIKQSSFNHFETNSIRNIIMPFNSEIIYSYFYVFKKNDLGFNLNFLMTEIGS